MALTASKLKCEITKGSDQMREPFQGGWYECPVCHEKFHISAGNKIWTFTKRVKGKPIYYCSWGCVRRTEVRADEQRTGDSDGVPDDRDGNRNAGKAIEIS